MKLSTTITFLLWLSRNEISGAIATTIMSHFMLTKKCRNWSNQTYKQSRYMLLPNTHQNTRKTDVHTHLQPQTS